jgi:hypothetical protein
MEEFGASIDLCDIPMAAGVQGVGHHLQGIVLTQEDNL